MSRQSSPIWRLRRFLSKASASIGKWILLPIHWLFQLFALPYRAIERLSQTSQISVREANWQDKTEKRQAIYSILSIPWRVVVSPITLVRNAVVRNQLVELACAIPLVLVLVLLSLVSYRVFFRAQALEQRYLLGAQHAVGRGDAVLAEKYFRRIMAKKNLSEDEIYNWSTILRLNGEDEKANELLDKIAPDDGEGLPSAHAQKAIQLSKIYSKPNEDPNEVDMQNFRWHLEHAESSAKVDLAWGEFHLVNGDSDQAIEYLENAAKTYPELELRVADICKQNKMEEKRTQALLRAQTAFKIRFEENPLDIRSRIVLGQIYTRLKKFNSAESTLLDGLELHDSANLKRAAAAFYLQRFETWPDHFDSTGEDSLERQLDLIKQSIKIDPEYQSSYIKLIARIDRDLTKVGLKKTRLNLQKIVTGNTPDALDHICLARVLWNESNVSQAKWHLDQAWRIDNGIGSLAEQLARVFAYGREPDLDWALQMAKKTTAEIPDNAEHLETLGSIQLLMGQHQQAIENMKRAIAGTNDPQKLHRKLEMAYQEINDHGQAKIHAEKSRQKN